VPFTHRGVRYKFRRLRGPISALVAAATAEALAGRSAPQQFDAVEYLSDEL
jgi:hypothetical protein